MASEEKDGGVRGGEGPERRVWVEKVELVNFRGFAGKHEVSLHPRLNVLVGLNGAGKSAVLDAVAGNLSSVASIVLGGRRAWMMAGDRANVAAGAETALWGIHFRDNAEWDSLANGAGDAPNRGTSEPPTWPILEGYRARISDPKQVLPYLAYVHSSSTRAPTAVPPVDVNLTGRLDAWKGAFDSESLQFDALEEWFEREENLENQLKIERRSLKYELPSLRAVRKALRLFLEGLHADKLGKVRVVRFHDQGKLAPARGQLVIEKGEHELFLRQLSDGERRLVLLVADTARRMVILNPGLEDPLQSPGVLLIDEIELHLHPQWQRRVISALQAAFPKVQLLVSTHAPAVLSTVPNECVVVLDNSRFLPGSPRVFGLDSNSILSDLMGTPTLPEAIQAKFDALYRLIDDAPEEAPAAIEALAAEVGPDHPELVRARGLLVFLAG